jgi:holo-[acyl-carrier protein] synthase
MAVLGVGIDVVEVSRFVAALERTPRLRDRLFVPDERDLPDASLAARFAVKEALAKALGAPGDLRWHDAVVRRIAGTAPQIEVSGTVRARLDALGIARLHVSISHDAGIAAAVVIAES